MADPGTAPAIGQIGWVDLTVPNATTVRDFYQHVTGWTPTAFCVIEDPAGAVAALFQPE
jgi:predicted enzyme related to lactoylglutathione lyase